MSKLSVRAPDGTLLLSAVIPKHSHVFVETEAGSVRIDARPSGIDGSRLHIDVGAVNDIGHSLPGFDMFASRPSQGEGADEK